MSTRRPSDRRDAVRSRRRCFVVYGRDKVEEVTATVVPADAPSREDLLPTDVVVVRGRPMGEG